MSKVSEIASAYKDKLEQQKKESQARLEQDLALVRSFSAQQGALSVSDISRKLGERSKQLQGDAQPPVAPPAGVSAQPPEAPPAAVNAQVALGGSALLSQLDEIFIRSFNLEKYYPPQPLNLPTVYTETLEEFFTPLYETQDVSPQVRQAILEQSMLEAETDAANGGGTFGYNLPGRGCYLNGWLFGRASGLQPRAALEHPDVLPHVLSTAIHEKLGHGFLGVYSALGKVKAGLGLERIELAARFGLRTADDPLSSLRLDQHNLIFEVSQLVEEGWSTWIAGHMQPSGPRKRHELAAVVQAVRELPQALPEDLLNELQDLAEMMKALLQALVILFHPGESNPSRLLEAVWVVNTLGDMLDEGFSRQIRQPLRYAVGELLFLQAEKRCGARCMPYLALLAANVNYDLQQISLSDLRQLLMHDPRIHPDARLATLSHLQLEQKGSLEELLQQAEALLSFSIPPELKKG